MEAIKRGSVYLTDDYIQAMLMKEELTASISSFSLVKLPDWSMSGIQITAEELGLSSGIVDPNILMPAAFLQYWYNLMAYARQYHANIQQQGIAVEDFAEQAFWKMITRLCRTSLVEDSVKDGSMTVYKSNEVIVNASNIDGNSFMEILLSIPVNVKRQTCIMRQSKPAYLSTANNLPIDQSNIILGGNELALYDKDKTYYDLRVAECLKSSYYREEEDSELIYNAILLHYTVKTSDGEVEQLAGIYFPDKFEQADDSGNMYYKLPEINKASDISHGYSINIMISQAGNVVYNAQNSSLSLALQIYQDAIQEQLRTKLQIEELQNRVVELMKQQDTLMTLLTSTKFAELDSRITAINNRIVTTLGGTVSANQLLELFLQAKENQGVLNLEMFMADLTDAMTDREIIVSNPLGAYRDNDVIPAGTAVTRVLENMLSNKIPPKYEQPNVVISIEGYLTYKVQYGSTLQIELQKQVLVGDSGGATPYRLYYVMNGKVHDFSNPNITFISIQEPIYSAVQVYYEVQFAEGPLKDYSDGTPCYAGHVFGGIISARMQIIPEFEIFYGGLDFIEQLEMTELSGLTVGSSTEMPSTYTSGRELQVIAIPANVTGLFTDTFMAVKDTVHNNMAYKIYVFNRIGVHLDYMKYREETLATQEPIHTEEPSTEPSTEPSDSPETGE